MTQIRCFASLILAALLWFGVAPPVTAQEIGTAAVVVRDVFGNSITQRLPEGTDLQANQWVRTGVDSAAEARFLDDTSLMVGDRSEVRLDRFVYDPTNSVMGGVIDISRGLLRFASTAQLAGRVDVQTPAGTIGIRGTRFTILADDEAVEVAVQEGEVAFELAGVGAGRTVTLGQGQVYRIGTDGSDGGFLPGITEQMKAALDRLFAILGERIDVRAASADALSIPVFSGPIRTVAAPTPGQVAPDTRAEDLLYLYLDNSDIIVIRMRPDLAPTTVARMRELARSGFFDGQRFYFVRDGFVAETGDPTETGNGGSGRRLPAEFSTAASFVRGAVGLLRNRNDPDSGDSRLFICLTPQTHLDGQYTLWGDVVSGMDAVDRLPRGEPPPNARLITRAAMGSDLRP